MLYHMRSGESTGLVSDSVLKLSLGFATSSFVVLKGLCLLVNVWWLWRCHTSIGAT